MRQFLLDSHALLWYLSGNAELPVPARISITDPEIPVFVSIASIWEIAIKHSLGKLELPKPFNELEPAIQNASFEILPIQFDDLKMMVKRPFHHGDPFDRLIIAQSLQLSIPVISRDVIFDMYGVQRFWAAF